MYCAGIVDVSAKYSSRVVHYTTILNFKAKPQEAMATKCIYVFEKVLRVLRITKYFVVFTYRSESYASLIPLNLTRWSMHERCGNDPTAANGDNDDDKVKHVNAELERYIRRRPSFVLEI